MKHLTKPFALLLTLCLLLAGCGQSSTPSSATQEASSTASAPAASSASSSAPSLQTETATLYTCRAIGHMGMVEPIQEHEFSYSGELTAELLAQGLSELTGLDFIITATETEESIAVDWSADSTLLRPLDEQDLRGEYAFYDADALRWFMLDSLWWTLSENLGCELILYSMNDGEDLSLPGLYLTDQFAAHFTADYPFVYSGTLLAHEGVSGLLSEERASEYVWVLLNQRGEEAPVIVSTGEERIGEYDCWTFAAGSNSADGQKFTAMYHYAVSKTGAFFYIDPLQGADWLPLEIDDLEPPSEMAELTVAFADAFFGGVQEPPTYASSDQYSLKCYFIAADGEGVVVEFGRDPSIAPDQQMYFFNMFDGQSYRVVFDGDDVILEDRNGVTLTPEQFIAK